MSPLFVHTLRPRGGPVVRGTELVLSQAAALRRGPSEASGESHLSPLCPHHLASPLSARPASPLPSLCSTLAGAQPWEPLASPTLPLMGF